MYVQIICMAAENGDVPLRRTEKRTLNDLNKKAFVLEAEKPGSTFAVHESRESRKLKQRVQEPWEKSFILVQFSLPTV